MPEHFSEQCVLPIRHRSRAPRPLNTPVSRNAMLGREIRVDLERELLTTYTVRIGESSGVRATQAACPPALPGERRCIPSVSRVESVRLGHVTQKLPDVSR